MPHAGHGHGGWHGGHRRDWGYFGYPVYYPWPTPDPWPAAVLADPSQVLDPLFDPAQMVDLSQGLDLSRTRGIDPAPLPGPSIIGLYGMFESDHVGSSEQPPRPRHGLLVLGKKKIKKAWKPRRLEARRGPLTLGAWPPVDWIDHRNARGEMFAHVIPWWR